MLKQHPHAVVVHADADALMVHPYLSAAFDGVGTVDGTLSAGVRTQIVAALRNGDAVLLAGATEALLHHALDDLMLALVEPAGSG